MDKRAEIVEKALQGYSQAETARLVGCSRSYVGLIKNEKNLRFADGHKKRRDIERDKAILWDYLNGTSFAKLGEKYGISAIQAFRVAANLIPCRPAQAKRILSGKKTIISDSGYGCFFDCLESLYGTAYKNLMEST